VAAGFSQTGALATVRGAGPRSPVGDLAHKTAYTRRVLALRGTGSLLGILRRVRVLGLSRRPISPAGWVSTGVLFAEFSCVFSTSDVPRCMGQFQFFFPWSC